MGYNSFNWPLHNEPLTGTIPAVLHLTSVSWAFLADLEVGTHKRRRKSTATHGLFDEERSRTNRNERFMKHETKNKAHDDNMLSRNAGGCRFLDDTRRSHGISGEVHGDINFGHKGIS